MKQCFLLIFSISFILHSSLAQDLCKAVDAKDYAKAESLLKSGAKVNKPNKGHQFPLWLAVWNEDTAMVKLLIAHGADIHQRFTAKEVTTNCLEIACQNGLSDIAKILIENGARADEKGFKGCSPLRVACRNGRIDIVKYLIGKGVEIDSEADDKATPLETAASKGHLEIVQLLVEKGANVNHLDKEGDSPLGEAARSGYIEVVQYLLSKGASTSSKNQKGQTAEEIARLAGQAKVEALLKEHRN